MWKKILTFVFVMMSMMVKTVSAEPADQFKQLEKMIEPQFVKFWDIDPDGPTWKQIDPSTNKHIWELTYLAIAKAVKTTQGACVVIKGGPGEGYQTNRRQWLQDNLLMSGLWPWAILPADEVKLPTLRVELYQNCLNYHPKMLQFLTNPTSPYNIHLP